MVLLAWNAAHDDRLYLTVSSQDVVLPAQNTQRVVDTDVAVASMSISDDERREVVRWQDNWVLHNFVTSFADSTTNTQNIVNNQWVQLTDLA